jgi:hypothetical protein
MLTFKNKRKQIFYIIITIFSLLLIMLLLLSRMISMDGEKRLKIVDQNGKDLSAVLIVPLYSSSYGIDLGPDGKGFHSSESLLIIRPFLFNSGEDIMSKKMPSQGIIFAPFGDKSGLFAGIFRSKNIFRFALIKKGYTPEVIKGENIYGISSIVMTMADKKQNTDIINTLLETPTNQDALRRIFGAGEIKGKIDVSLDKQDIAFLKATID